MEGMNSSSSSSQVNALSSSSVIHADIPRDFLVGSENGQMPSSSSDFQKENGLLVALLKQRDADLAMKESEITDLIRRLQKKSPSLLMDEFFPQRAFHLVVHEMLDGRDLGRLDIAVGSSSRQREYLHSVIDNVTWESFIHFRCWSPSLLKWMQQRNISLPKELAEHLNTKKNNAYFLAEYEVGDDEMEPDFPAIFNPEIFHIQIDGSNGSIAARFPADLLLIEQFMASLMFDAVLVMLKAGYPQDLEQKFIVSRYAGGIGDSNLCIDERSRSSILTWALSAGAVDIVRYLHAERNVDVFLKVDETTSFSRTEGFLKSLESIYRTFRVKKCRFQSKLPLVKFFVEELGVNPHDPLSCFGDNALHFACNNIQYETAVYLIEKHDMKVRTKDSEGEDVLGSIDYYEFGAIQEEDWKKLKRYVEKRAKSEGSADNFKTYVCNCEKCVARRAEEQEFIHT